MILSGGALPTWHPNGSHDLLYPQTILLYFDQIVFFYKVSKCQFLKIGSRDANVLFSNASMQFCQGSFAELDPKPGALPPCYFTGKDL